MLRGNGVLVWATETKKLTSAGSNVVRKTLMYTLHIVYLHRMPYSYQHVCATCVFVATLFVFSILQSTESLTRYLRDITRTFWIFQIPFSSPRVETWIDILFGFDHFWSIFLLWDFYIIFPTVSSAEQFCRTSGAEAIGLTLIQGSRSESPQLAYLALRLDPTREIWSHKMCI